ncbi:DUF485 domain-containing protein [Streptomyces wuyuanensis]|uniref:Uncharacterized membrane protein, DUF485 family n=1 Tax=Streptomyces wuyuanensis TaxID=1196353 RepID=A0A1G9UYV2_9ACTN|nr:DUF485 domain-containing protein [Streptomyces wuyuanensis]SDM65098.1 Uncharacterized membrane protein, DUF485 family [Streptomyces wuyuanensis]
MSYDPYFPDPPGPSRQPWHAPQPPPDRGYVDPFGDPFGEAPPAPYPDPDPYTEPGRTPAHELPRLRSGYRRLRRVATLTALGYFVLFLILSGYAPGLMTGGISGGLTTGVLLGLLTLPVTLVAIAVYEHIARRRVDPLAAAIRTAHDEGHAPTSADRQAGRNRPGGSAWDRPTGGMRI